MSSFETCSCSLCNKFYTYIYHHIVVLDKYIHSNLVYSITPLKRSAQLMLFWEVFVIFLGIIQNTELRSVDKILNPFGVISQSMYKRNVF